VPGSGLSLLLHQLRRHSSYPKFSRWFSINQFIRR
jgi:hypothetical protein